MVKNSLVSQEVREGAVRLVFDSANEYGSQWAAIQSIASKIGCTPETLQRWVGQVEKDSGAREGLTTDEKARIKQLEKEIREFKQADENLRLVSAYFAKATKRPAQRRTSCIY